MGVAREAGEVEEVEAPEAIVKEPLHYLQPLILFLLELVELEEQLELLQGQMEVIVQSITLLPMAVEVEAPIMAATHSVVVVAAVLLEVKDGALLLELKVEVAERVMLKRPEPEVEAEGVMEVVAQIITEMELEEQELLQVL